MGFDTQSSWRQNRIGIPKEPAEITPVEQRFMLRLPTFCMYQAERLQEQGRRTVRQAFEQEKNAMQDLSAQGRRTVSCCPYELAEEGDEERTRVNIWETIEMVVVYIFIAPTCIGEFNCRLIGEARLNALDYREESRK